MSDDFIADYELGQVCIRQITGAPPSVPIDPAFAESVGAEMRPVLQNVCDGLLAAWRAIPEGTRERLARLGETAGYVREE